MQMFDPSIDIQPVPGMSQQYALTLEAVAPSITQKIADQTDDGESWTDVLERLLPSLVTTYAQKQILDAQLEQAKRGLPPLNVSNLNPGVNVGLAPDVQKLVIFGGIALIGVALFAARKR